MTTTLPKPKSQTAEVLRALIVENEISEQMFSQNGFRSRLTELRRKGVPIRDKWKSKINKYGNLVQYKVHYLLTINRAKAIKLYEKINKK